MPSPHTIKRESLKQISEETLQQLKPLWNRLGLGVWHWDIDKDKIICHESYAILIGWETPSQLPTSPWLPRLFAADLEKTKLAVQKAIADGKQSMEVVFRVFHRKKGLRWHLCKGFLPSQEDDGLIRRIEFANVDVTETQSLIHRLEESDLRLKTLLKIMPGMFYRVSASQHRSNIFVSEQSKEILGYDAVDALKYHIKAIIHPDDKEEVERLIAQALDKRETFELIFRTSVDGEEWKWVWERGIGVYDVTGKPVALEGFITDMTYQKKVEARLRQENIVLKAAMKERYRFHGIIGKSEVMQTVYAQISRAAASMAPAIIYGESGTGKELVARAIHELSDRQGQRFVAVNCGAIAETLMEREFFGHAKGAFTGAVKDSDGFLGMADGGTLFLDELGEINLSMQVKLLRVLEGHGYRPVGGHTNKKTNVRIIAATNRNLSQLVKEGRIRSDFFYRIHVLPIELPPLRNRREDIPLLTEAFLKKIAGDAAPSLSPSQLETLTLQPWPGNVRELQNLLQRYVAFGEQVLPDAPSVLPQTPAPTSSADSLARQMAQFEAAIIRKTLISVGWHRGRAAKKLAIDPKTLYRKMKTLSVSEKESSGTTA